MAELHASSGSLEDHFVRLAIRAHREAA